MPTLIIAGDATTGLVQSAAVDGALTIQSGPAGAKVDAIALSSTGGATFSQITGGALTRATAQATTSGTSIDFTGIPSWVKRITVMLNGVSTNGTSVPMIQIGSGSVTTSGYTGSVSATSATSAAAAMANGAYLSTVWAAANVFSGQVVIAAFGSGNTYTITGTLGFSSSTSTIALGAVVTLSGALDRVRLTTFNGTDAFDAGSVNIMYEG